MAKLLKVVVVVVVVVDVVVVVVVVVAAAVVVVYNYSLTDIPTKVRLLDLYCIRRSRFCRNCLQVVFSIVEF